MLIVKSPESKRADRTLNRAGAVVTDYINVSAESDGTHVQMLAADGSLVTEVVLAEDMMRHLIFTLRWAIGETQYVPVVELPSGD